MRVLSWLRKASIIGFPEGSKMVFRSGQQPYAKNPINCTDQVGKECARIHGTCSYEVLVGGVLVRAYGLSF